MSADNPGPEVTTEVTTDTDVAAEAQAPEETEELLVEEISIDGMCGVY